MAHVIYLITVIIIGLFNISIIVINAQEKYEMIWVLPFSFILCCSLFYGSLKCLGKSIVGSILFAMMFLKCQIIPFLIALGKGHYFACVDTSNYLPYAYCLCIYEMVVVFWVIHKTYLKNSPYINQSLCIKMRKREANFIFMIMLVVLILFLVVVVLCPQMLLFYDFGLSTSEEETIYRNTLSMNIQDSVPKVYFYSFKILFDWLRWLFPLAIIFKIYVSKHIRGLFAILFSIIIILFSAVLGTDYRAASIFILLSLFILLTRLYPSYKKRIYTTCLVMFLMIGIGGLIIKSFGASNVGDAGTQDLANVLQSYFSGPDNVAIGLMMQGYPSLEVFIGDIFKWTPYVNHFFKDFDSSMIQFNYTFFKEPDITTQILPMISQGERYFSAIGAPIFTYIVSMTAFYTEKKLLKANTVISYTIYIMLAVSLPFTVAMYCFSQLLNIYLGTFFPTIMVLYFCNRKYNKKTTFKSIHE